MNDHPSTKGDILIVDDTLDNLRFLSAMLAEQGYEVRAVTNGLSRTLSSPVKTAVYRIVQEGLTNICKYAKATAVQLQIQTTASGLLLVLEDNGKGFRIHENQSGFGLQGMRERVAALGGHP